MAKCVRISPQLGEQIRSESRVAFPRECCGLVEGIRDGQTVEVTRLYPARNLSKVSDRFEIAAEDHFAAQRNARAAGKVIVGCYHSHPNGSAHPSSADLRSAAEEGLVWLITNDISLNAFEFLQGQFVDLELVTA